MFNSIVIFSEFSNVFQCGGAVEYKGGKVALAVGAGFCEYSFQMCANSILCNGERLSGLSQRSALGDQRGESCLGGCEVVHPAQDGVDRLNILLGIINDEQGGRYGVRPRGNRVKRRQQYLKRAQPRWPRDRHYLTMTVRFARRIKNILKQTLKMPLILRKTRKQDAVAV